MTEDIDDLGRAGLTATKRIALLERDRAQQSRIITELVTKAHQGFSPEQLAQIKSAMRETLADVGLRIESEEHQDEARRDFMFLRSLRNAANGTASKIGWFFIAAILGAVVWLVSSGLTYWKSL